MSRIKKENVDRNTPKRAELKDIEEIKKFVDNIEESVKGLEENQLVKSFFNTTEKNAISKLQNNVSALADRVTKRMDKRKDEIQNGEERRELLKQINKMSVEELQEFVKTKNQEEKEEVEEIEN